MPDVNDDMDELFKKAAEHYPLNTNTSDWNEVYKALPSLDVPSNASLNSTGNKNKSRRLLWLLLLLLLPFMGILYKYSFSPGHQTFHKGRIAETNDTGLPGQKNIVTENADRKESKETYLSSTNTIALSSKNVVPKNRLQTSDPIVTGYIPTQKIRADKAPGITAEDIDAKSSKSLPNQPGNAIKAEAPVNEEYTGKTAAALQKGEINKDIKKNTQVNSETEKPGNKAVVATADVKPLNNITKADKPHPGNQHFYAGITGGADLSSVKLQKIIKTGFTGGIIAGYKLNKKWSIESGFYLDKKYYYTEGKYFDAKKLPIPPAVKIEDASGNCNMIELPLNLRYNFKPNKKGNWFAIGGVSSYFMKKEDYGYKLSTYGVTPWQREYSYKNSSKNWASIINLSAGYSRNIGKTGTLRIEPYIKIPVKGVGIGSLPITSSGIYLGLTKNIF